MSISERIQSDLKEAMKARHQKKVDALRLITAAVKQIEVDERIQVDEQRFLGLLDKMAKQRKESIAIFQTANRVDLIEKEEYELALISHYLPKQLSEAEVLDLVNQAIKDNKAEKVADIGKVMASLKPLIQGRADMSTVSNMVRSRLTV